MYTKAMRSCLAPMKGIDILVSSNIKSLGFGETGGNVFPAGGNIDGNLHFGEKFNTAVTFLYGKICMFYEPALLPVATYLEKHS